MSGSLLFVSGEWQSYREMYLEKINKKFWKLDHIWPRNSFCNPCTLGWRKSVLINVKQSSYILIVIMHTLILFKITITWKGTEGKQKAIKWCVYQCRILSAEEFRIHSVELSGNYYAVQVSVRRKNAMQNISKWRLLLRRRSAAI